MIFHTHDKSYKYMIKTFAKKTDLKKLPLLNRVLWLTTSGKFTSFPLCRSCSKL